MCTRMHLLVRTIMRACFFFFDLPTGTYVRLIDLLLLLETHKDIRYVYLYILTLNIILSCVSL